MEKLLLRVDEAASALGMSRSKVYAMIASGELPSVRVGASVRVNLSGLKSWLASQGVQLPQTPSDTQATKG